MLTADSPTVTTGIPWVDTLILWAGVIGVIGGGWAVIVRHVVPFLRDISSFLRDWKGEESRPGYDERPGIPARLAVVESSQKETHATVLDMSRKVGDGKWATHSDVENIKTTVDSMRGELHDHLSQSTDIVTDRDGRLADHAARIAALEAVTHVVTVTPESTVVATGPIPTPHEETP